MPETQPAVVNFAPEPDCVELREIPIPAIGNDDVLLKVAAVGVCGSDLHQWTSQHSWPVNYPVTLGHEFAGIIARTGESVQGFQEGDRVCSETAAVIDPSSPMTRIGRYNLDPNRKGFGYGVDGAMTQYVRVPARCLHRVPESLDLSIAALTEPCCVAFKHFARRSGACDWSRTNRTTLCSNGQTSRRACCGRWITQRFSQDGNCTRLWL
jgi:alcohol dehydrogenase/L-iditol 2-dehydrogenase